MVFGHRIFGFSAQKVTGAQAGQRSRKSFCIFEVSAGISPAPRPEREELVARS